MQEKVQTATNWLAPTGGGLSVAGALTFNELLALGGFLLALGSFVVNWYYQHKRDKREQQRCRDGV